MQPKPKSKRIRSILEHLQSEVPEAQEPTEVAAEVPADMEEEEDDLAPSTPVPMGLKPRKKRSPYTV